MSVDERQHPAMVITLGGTRNVVAVEVTPADANEHLAA